MIIGVQDIYLNVADMDRAVAFYTELLGCRLVDTSPYWSSLDAFGLRLGLHWNGGQPVPAMPHDSHGPHAGACLTLKSDDIGADLDRLQHSNVTIIGQLDESFGKLIVFQDPDGNILKLMEPAYT